MKLSRHVAARAALAAALIAIPMSAAHHRAAADTCSFSPVLNGAITGNDGHGSSVTVEISTCGGGGYGTYRAATYNGYSETQVDLRESGTYSGVTHATGTNVVTTVPVAVHCGDRYFADMSTVHSDGTVGAAQTPSFTACTS